MVLFAGCVTICFCRVRHRIMELQEELEAVQVARAQTARAVVPEGYGYRYMLPPLPPPPPLPPLPAGYTAVYPSAPPMNIV